MSKNNSNGYMQQSNSDEWGTPVSLFIGACVEFNVTPYLDVCATFQNTKCPRFFNKEFKDFCERIMAFNPKNRMSMK